MINQSSKPKRAYILAIILFFLPAIIGSIAMSPETETRGQSISLLYLLGTFLVFIFLMIRVSVISFSKNRADNVTGFSKVLNLLPGLIGIFCLLMLLFVFFMVFLIAK